MISSNQGKGLVMNTQLGFFYGPGALVHKFNSVLNGD